MSDTCQFLFTSRGLLHDLGCKVSDDLRDVFIFYGFFVFNQKNLSSVLFNKQKVLALKV